MQAKEPDSCRLAFELVKEFHSFGDNRALGIAEIAHPVWMDLITQDIYKREQLGLEKSDDILGSIEANESEENIRQFQDRVSSLFYYLNFTNDLASARHYVSIDILESLVSNEDQETIKTNINNRWVELKTP